MAWRVAFLTVAILLGGALAPVIRDALGGAYLGHFVMALFMSGLMLVGIWLCIIGLSKARARVAPAAEGSLMDQLRVVRHNRAFVALLIGFVIQALGLRRDARAPRSTTPRTSSGSPRRSRSCSSAWSRPRSS